MKEKDNSQEFDTLLKQALNLKASEQTVFLEAIEDPDIRNKINFIIRTSTQSSIDFLKTGAGSHIEVTTIQGLVAGDKVDDRYLIKEILGKGGMGVVYLAFDETLKRKVAIKAIRPEFSLKTTTRQRFNREAQILSKINDKTICQIYDFIEKEEYDYLVLEYIDGKTLTDVVSDISHTQKLELLIELSDALSSAHKQGIVHRDLKPDNLMVNNKGKLKILDFGIARSMDTSDLPNRIKTKKPNPIEQKTGENLTKKGVIMGTLRYMSPEQVLLNDVTTSSDIYSLGLIIQETLTCKHAYDLKDTEDLHDKVIKAQLVIPNDLDADLQSLIADATQINPDKRPSAHCIKNILLEILEKPLKKRKLVSKVAFSTSFFLLVLFLFWQWNNNRIESKNAEFINQTTQQSKQIQVELQNVYMLPKHNIQSDIAKITINHKSLLDEIDNNNDISIRAKYMLKGDLSNAVLQTYKAANYYEKAWLLDDKDYAVLSKLSDAYVYLLWSLQHNSFYQADYYSEKVNIEKQALKYAKLSSQHNPDEKNLTHAFLLYRDKKLNQSLSLIDELLAHEDWDFHAYLLKAYTFSTIAINNSQKDISEIIPYYKKSVDEFKKAITRARSYPDAYIGLCEMNRNLIRISLTRSGFEVEPYVKEAITACKDALIINPDFSIAKGWLSSIYSYYAEIQISKGQSADESLDKALYWNDQHLTGDPKFWVYINRAEIHSKQALIDVRKGNNPSNNINHAVDSYNKSLELNPGNINTTAIGILYNIEIKAQYELIHGIDLQGSVDQAEAIFNQINFQNTPPAQLVVLHMNMAAIYYLQAQNVYQSKGDVKSIVNKGIALLQQHIELFKSEAFILGIRAQLYSVLIQFLVNNKTDATHELAQLKQNIDQSLALYPGLNELLMIKGKEHFLRFQINKNYDIDFIESQKYYLAAIKANTHYAPALVDYAKLLMWTVQNRKNNQKAMIADAIQACDQAIAINNHYSFAYYIKAQLIELAYEKNIETKGKLSQAKLLFQKAQSINPLLVSDRL